MPSRDEIRTALTNVALLDREIEQATEQREKAAGPLESAANALLEANRAYTRPGQHATYRRAETNRHEETVYVFGVSNGIDDDAEFQVVYSFDELCADVIEVRRQEARADLERQLKRAQLRRTEADGLVTRLQRELNDANVVEWMDSPDPEGWQRGDFS